MVKASATGGVEPMTITGRMVRERERCIGMSPEERAWRAQWVKDQHLTAREPVYVKELFERNPIREFYMRPLDKLLLEPLSSAVGKNPAIFIRTVVGKSLTGLLGIYAAVYYFKYNHNDWTKKSGFKVYWNRPRVVPGDPGYPKLSDRTKFSDYASRGFKNSPI